MTDSPLVSVVIPVYNAEATLGATVESVLSQTYRNIEVVLVDDGSTDGSLAVAYELSRADRRIRAIHSENGGVSRARNRGIDEAKGDYLMFVDADDLLEPEAAEALVGDALAGGAPLAICGMSFDTLDESGRLVSGRARSMGWSAIVADLAHAGCTYERLYEANYVQSAWAKLFSLEELRAFNIRFDESLSSFEDHAFMLSCLACMAPLAVDARVLYRYCLRPGVSNSTKYKADMADQMAHVADCEMRFYEETLGRPRDEAAYRHAAQFLVVAINNAQKTPGGLHASRLAVAEVFRRQIFADVSKNATSFPNGYSHLISRSGNRGLYGCVVLLAAVRNWLRSRHGAR